MHNMYKIKTEVYVKIILLCKHFTYLISTLILASSFVYIWHNSSAKFCGIIVRATLYGIIVNAAMALTNPHH